MIVLLHLVVGIHACGMNLHCVLVSIPFSSSFNLHLNPDNKFTDPVSMVKLCQENEQQQL